MPEPVHTTRAILPFDALFLRNEDGSFSPRKPIYVGAIAVMPGMRLDPGTPHAGFDIAHYSEHELDVTHRDDGAVILHGCHR